MHEETILQSAAVLAGGRATLGARNEAEPVREGAEFVELKRQNRHPPNRN